MCPAARFDVEARVSRDLRHAPFLLDGLDALARAGEVRVRLRPRPPHRRDRLVVSGSAAERVARPYPWSTDLRVLDHETGERRQVSIDLQDWREMYSATSVRTADVVVKRMYTDPEVQAVRAAYGIEVVPAGITGPGDASRWATRWPVRVAGLLGRVQSVVDSPRLLGERLGHRRGSPPSAPPSGVIPTSDPELPEHFVFFQVAHHDWVGSTEANRLNQHRADLIRALRAGLGPRFVGGMTFAGRPPADLADCVSGLSSARESYLRLVGRAAVVVATNGFGGSPPWKLYEYLERGACIVSESPVATLPRPLVDGQTVVSFTGVEGAVDAAARLLDAPDEREALRAGASAYFADQVAPAAAVRRYLTAREVEEAFPA